MNANWGYVKVASAVPALKVADCEYNVQQMLPLIENAVQDRVQILVFPELSVTAYSCGDLFTQSFFLNNAVVALENLLQQTAAMDILFVVGMPLSIENKLFNTAVVCRQGEVMGVVPKTYLPNYKEFYEKRWFSSAAQLSRKEISLAGCNCPVGTDIMFVTPQANLAIEICEDLWMPVPPSSLAAMKGADLILNLSASNELVGKHDYLRSLIIQQSARCVCGYMYSSAGFGESSTDVVFAGKSLIAENGKIMAENDRFSFDPSLTTACIDVEKLRSDRLINSGFTSGNSILEIPSYREIPVSLPDVHIENIPAPERYPFVPADVMQRDCRCAEIFAIQVAGLAKRMKHTAAKSLVIGISGGLDSTLALLVSVKACDKLNIPRKNIIGITMPGFGTTNRTYHNALSMMTQLGVTVREINIGKACMQHFADIGHNAEIHDVTYENSQARERTQILMDVANQTGGLVVGTGDMSELALGWATYNGDHMSMYGVNASVPKTLVKYLVSWVADNENEEIKKVLYDVIDTPISPELIPADENGDIKQKTEDLVGPYELHDFYLYHFLRNEFSPRKIYFLACKTFAHDYSDDTIKKWLTIFFRRFFNQQFKRSCLPDGPKVGSVALSPRGDWRMPSDASAALWLDECNSL